MILYEVWYCDTHKDSKWGSGSVCCVNVMAESISIAINTALEDTEKDKDVIRSVHCAKEINGGRCIMQGGQRDEATKS